MSRFLYFISILFSLLFSNSLSAQTAPPILWEKTIGGTGYDAITCMATTQDGGVVMGLWSNSDRNGIKNEDSRGEVDYWIVKTDIDGNIQWEKTIGGDRYDQLNSIAQTLDGDYILGGTSFSDKSGDKSDNSAGIYQNIDYWVVRLDSQGEILWQITLGGEGYERLLKVSEVPTGGFVLAGISASSNSGKKNVSIYGGFDVWLVKIDALGEIEWQRAYGGDDTDYIADVLPTRDGGYLLGCTTSSGISGNKTDSAIGSSGYASDFWIIKTDAFGNIEWQKTIGGNLGEEVISIGYTLDGAYFLGGWSNSDIGFYKSESNRGQLDYWLVKIDLNGHVLWDRTYGGDYSDYFQSAQVTADNGFIIGGWSASSLSGDKSEANTGSFDMWVLKLDSLGNIQWDKCFGGEGPENLFSVLATPDGGYALGGMSRSGKSDIKSHEGYGLDDGWLVRLAPDSLLIPFIPEPLSSVPSFPNVVTSNGDGMNDFFNHGLTGDFIQLKIYNRWGKEVFKTLQPDDKWSGSNLSTGIYFYALDYFDRGVPVTAKGWVQLMR